MQNSALYRNPTGEISHGNFKCDPFYYLWEEKLTSSMVKGQFFCTFLCVGEPRCYSFNVAEYPDSNGLYLCELLVTDKYRATGKLFANATFIHSFSVSFQSPCESAPCMNGGVCVPEYEWNSYHCDCKPGFCGTHCKQGGIKWFLCVYVYIFPDLKNTSVEGLALFLFVIGHFHWSVHNYSLLRALHTS